MTPESTTLDTKISDAKISDIMSPDLSRLFAAARAAQGRAYAPYSRFPVGAALLDESGALHAGCNVENAAYPVGTCAEAGAIAAMVASGGRRIAAVLVLGPGPGLVTPCGACRQRIREFAGPAVRVHVADPAGLRVAFTVGALLPDSFGPDNLGAAPGGTDGG
jgi:cytidine deaminase